ncbi:DNA glycosylase [Dissoconium aciculare CBS 342.82]|uniref:DNA glycosylase n=1 Tax=Dissoconium aciculare CBS 342.82 TaxID=1314786 RepID=A0A6J3M8V4_9PEZI|nr:DNA glycosylase [Dissoconium aciculare CBS 342.82]KAF1824308.1 DNA glycosylase [Dissoconium aciculare CBS 342.82]
MSANPVPSILEDKFGIVQERLWQEPFWLIIAVVFLNQTTGRAAMPVFWALKARYITIENIANADVTELRTMIEHLGLGNQRSKRIVEIAKVWLTNPPTRSRRYRTLHYPSPGDGKSMKSADILEDDVEITPGALELGHMPGCKQYAYDSWRIFCRDVLRGVADDYRGLNAKDFENFEPEWKRVVPLDKELRACLRWMWLREGYIWDPLTGEKRFATSEEMAQAIRGQMEIEDPQERKFARQAVENSAADAGKYHREVTDVGNDADPVTETLAQ